MKLKILEFSLCRTPTFSLEDTVENKWKELKILIKDASPSFYQVIADTNETELNEVSEKIGFSIWKYFNRAKYRATPFGGFAAFTVLPLSEDEKLPLILKNKFSTFQFVDWKEKDAYTADIPGLISSSSLFQANSSIYTVGNEIRYIRFKNDCFEVASVNGFPELNTILSLCREKTTKQKLFKAMESGFQMQVQDIIALLEQLFSLQLLFTEQCPNITGEDYFKRLNLKSSAPDSTYTISERKLIKGGLNTDKLNDILEMLGFLSRNLPEQTNSALDSFRNAFIKRFDQRLIPLGEALDPETGVGYSNLGQPQSSHDLLDILESGTHNVKPESKISYTNLHIFLLNGLMKGGNIDLKDFKDTQTTNELPLPNTLSVLFHYWKGRPVIQSAGSCTANTLLGRFTIASPELEKFSYEIASLEEEANPGILFFDIAYQAEKQVDNVNRRKQLYKNELPILTWSCNPSPLNFDDILVGVRDKEIILWSKKYRKRIIPRIPSAYNYTRSDLAVYRFLCDLQHQQIKSDLNFNIQHFFPSLNSYPRIVYKSVIVSRAMWQVPTEFLTNNKPDITAEKKLRLIKWLHQEGIDFMFRAGNSDQTLCFDPKIDEDLNAFLLFCQKSMHKEKDNYISEALILAEDGIKDENDTSYTAEIITHYGHSNPIYKPYEALGYSKNTNIPVHNIILPGGEWLCFEIYCYPARSNYLLLNEIILLLRENESNIRKWFFIRYNDPTPHIRLRLQLKEIAGGNFFISRLKFLLKEDCIAGLIRDIQIKTYFRETERYGPSRIDLVEKLFFIDSKYALLLLDKAKTTEQLYATTLTVIQRLLGLGLPEINDQIIFVKNIADHFTGELSLNYESFKKINLSYQSLKEHMKSNIVMSAVKLSGRHDKLFSAIIEKCQEDTVRTKMIADLFHMHINRLFHSDQRTHEAIVYHYLLKILESRRALSVAEAKQQVIP